MCAERDDVEFQLLSSSYFILSVINHDISVCEGLTMNDKYIFLACYFICQNVHHCLQLWLGDMDLKMFCTTYKLHCDTHFINVRTGQQNIHKIFKVHHVHEEILIRRQRSSFTFSAETNKNNKPLYFMLFYFVYMWRTLPPL